MGIKIEATQTIDFPYPFGMTLECDAAREIFCRGVEVFADPQGFIGCHKLAMKAGWLERNTSTGREWLCPRCSGKVSS